MAEETTKRKGVYRPMNPLSRFAGRAIAYGFWNNFSSPSPLTEGRGRARSEAIATG